jgi:hypothetical protein
MRAQFEHIMTNDSRDAFDDRMRLALEAIAHLKRVALSAADLMEKGHHLRYDLQSTLPNLIERLRAHMTSALAHLADGEHIEGFRIVFLGGGIYAAMRKMEASFAPVFEASPEFKQAWAHVTCRLLSVLDIRPDWRG